MNWEGSRRSKPYWDGKRSKFGHERAKCSDEKRERSERMCEKSVKKR